MLIITIDQDTTTTGSDAVLGASFGSCPAAAIRPGTVDVRTG